MGESLVKFVVFDIETHGLTTISDDCITPHELSKIYESHFCTASALIAPSHKALSISTAKDKIKYDQLFSALLVN
jgi:DNA polymerase III alpha subunit (gram-positive type)